MSKKTKRFIVLISLIASLSLLLAGCGTDKAKSEGSGKLPKEVTIGYQVIPNAELLVKTLGLAEKKFPDVKINWKPFDSGRDVNTAVAAGSIDLGLAGSVPVAIGVANKLPYQVYFLHDIIGDAESLAVRKSEGTQSIKDLAGKKVAVPFGSTSHFSLLSALKSEGVDPASVTILDLQPQDILAAWQRKDIDGAFVWNPTLGKLLADDGTVLVSAKQLADKGIITADVGIVRSAFAKDYPDFLKQYVSVLDEAVQSYRDHPEDAAKALAPVLSTDEADALAQTKQLVWLTSKEQQDAKYLGSKPEESGFADVLLQTGQFLVEQKQIPSAPSLGDYQKAINQAALQQ
ncbi:ABC transporter substrate-binding protein [Cohnella candidum]|uniref:Taurine ABC transporter substrate-binding protein n=1 Tax=Cohnella candidum TaxID=2674991 RepID=A0A3G3K5W3_9BACL|nr:ABC transporter substrate-binding protein [Cohnella candidum]AYQ75169.1 taurine ABC transporter substrate-binding protein [Cohnella candidum]